MSTQMREKVNHAMRRKSFGRMKKPRFTGVFLQAGDLGFEPRLTAPEAVVLPLHQSPIVMRSCGFRMIFRILRISGFCGKAYEKQGVRVSDRELELLALTVIPLLSIMPKPSTRPVTPTAPTMRATRTR
jgi:hypothetical protein